MAAIDIRDLFDDEPQESGSMIKTTKQESFSHQIYFDEDIGEPSKYRELVNLLYTSQAGTEFNFFMNTSGGSLSSAVAIVEAIKATQGDVRAIIVGECHSAGSIIALSCHEIIVCDSASMLVHTASYGTGGCTPNVQNHVDFSSKYINKILSTVYDGFLSDTELSEVKRGVECWCDADDIRKRLEARGAKFAKSDGVVTPEVVEAPKRRSKAK
jgi:ATP-dependent protease ClpP protease subunit